MPTIIECDLCRGEGIRGDGHACRPCAGMGWEAIEKPCGNCADGNRLEYDHWAGEPVDVRCPCCVRRPATQPEAAWAHNRHMAIARAKSSDELAAVLAQYDAPDQAAA